MNGTTARIQETGRRGFARLLTPFTETFGLSRPLAISSVLFIGAITLVAVFWFFESAPPHTITITAGPAGSSFETNAVKYRDILARSGVKLKILPSQGSMENLQRLDDPSFKVDIGFVQGGVTNQSNATKLVSLGSISFQPLLVFYRSPEPLGMLSQLAGKRLAIGPVGSGTRTLAVILLQLNGVHPGDTNSTAFLDLDSEDAAKALMERRADAVFLMGDSASVQVMLKLLRTPEIQLLDFTQADAYTRKITYLNKLDLPMGGIDFGQNIPRQDVHLIGPTVELLARPDLHPALSDLLLEAAREVHGGASLLKRRGEFPAPLEQDYPISAEATRYYKTGKSFLYRSLPFWLASLINRVLVAFVPAVIVMIPAVRLIPTMYRWRLRLRLYRWYRALLLLDRDLIGNLTPEKQKELQARLDEIEEAVNKMKVPASFADQFYGLRGHIDFVRTRLLAPTAEQK